MPRNPKPAVLTLRMAPQLRESLHAAAHEAGCSLNQYATQVLATVGGNIAAFRTRVSAAAGPENAVEKIARLLDRDRNTKHEPSFLSGRELHRIARREYLASKPLPDNEMSPHVRRLDVEDPNFYIRWYFDQHPDDAEHWLKRLLAA